MYKIITFAVFPKKHHNELIEKDVLIENYTFVCDTWIFENL